MSSTALTKITKRAKQIRKAHPSMSWINAVKKSSAEYRGGAKKKTGHKKKTRTAAPKKRPGTRKTRSATASISGFSTSQLRAHLKKGYEEKLAWGLLKQKKATSSKSKKAASKNVAMLIKNLKALQ